MKKLMLILLCGSFLNQFSYAQPKVDLQFSVLGESVEFVVMDKWLRKTGEDPRGTGSSYEQIPKANYSTEGVGDDLWYNTFNYAFISNTEANQFTIQLIGTNLSKFNFNINATPDDQNYSEVNESIKTFLDKDTEMTYKFTYYGSSGTPAKVEKVIAITSLGQDITAGGKLNLVGNQTFVNSLLSQCNQMATYFNAGNKRSAHNTLNAINYSIQTAFSNPTATQFVNEYANAVLMEDIQLTYQLINCQNCPSTERLQK